MSDYFAQSGLGEWDYALPGVTPPVDVPVPALTADAFRVLLPEFKDTTVWPDVTINAWIGIAIQFVDPIRWGSAGPLGTALYIAHNLVLGAQAAAAVAGGGVPGASSGVIASKSVGPLSKSYDTTLGTLDGIGSWNLTSYGVRYQQLLRLFGAGGVQL